MTSVDNPSGTGHELAMRLRAAYAFLRRRTSAALLPVGLSSDQFVLLTVLAREGAASQQQLVQRCHSDTNTLGAMLSLLEAKGLVKRSEHSGDGRAWMVSLTATGRALQRKAWEHSESLRTELVGLFSPDEARSLLNLLERVTAAMRPHLNSRSKHTRHINGALKPNVRTNK